MNTLGNLNLNTTQVKNEKPEPLKVAQIDMNKVQSIDMYVPGTKDL